MSEHAIEVIPVIDLKDGAVVRARPGSRHSYAPIVTPLARTSAPLDIVAGLLTIHPFSHDLRGRSRSHRIARQP
jgi:phosphoribosylformimino-5-aminoimidazole carboxamide ribotide isomerase